MPSMGEVMRGVGQHHLDALHLGLGRVKADSAAVSACSVVALVLEELARAVELGLGLLQLRLGGGELLADLAVVEEGELLAVCNHAAGGNGDVLHVGRNSGVDVDSQVGGHGAGHVHARRLRIPPVTGKSCASFGRGRPGSTARRPGLVRVRHAPTVHRIRATRTTRPTTGVTRRRQARGAAARNLDRRCFSFYLISHVHFLLQPRTVNPEPKPSSPPSPAYLRARAPRARSRFDSAVR